MLSYSLSGQQWPAGSIITYSFSDPGYETPFGGYSALFDADQQAIAQQALAAWAAACGVQFQQVAYVPGAPADLVFGFASYLPTDVYLPNDNPFGSGPFSPGQPVALADPATDPLTADGSGVLRYALDNASFYQAVAAGIGGALGLAQSSDPASVLYPEFSSANAGLGLSDIAGAQDLYGPPPGQSPAVDDFRITPGDTSYNFDITLADSLSSYTVHPTGFSYLFGDSIYDYTAGATIDRNDGLSFATGNAIEVMNFSDGPVVLDEYGHSTEDIARIYEGAFGRIPDLAGLQTYADGYYAYDPAAVAAIAVASPEYAQRYGTPSNTQFVTQIYENAAGRAPDPGGLAAYVGYLDAGVSRGDVLLAMSESQESKAYSAAEIGDQSRSEVYRLYETVFGQPPDATTQADDATQLDAYQIQPQQIAADLLGGSLYASLYGAPDNTSFVTDLYQNAAGRAPDPGGLQTYVTDLDNGLSRDALTTFFADSAEARALFAPATSDGIVHVT